MLDRACALVLVVLVDPRRPSHEPMKGVGRIDVALSSYALVCRIEHEQIAFPLELVHKRLLLVSGRERALEGRGKIRARPGAERNQLLDLASGQPSFVDGHPAGHRRALGIHEPGAKRADDSTMRRALGASVATAPGCWVKSDPGAQRRQMV